MEVLGAYDRISGELLLRSEPPKLLSWAGFLISFGGGFKSSSITNVALHPMDARSKTRAPGRNRFTRV